MTGAIDTLKAASEAQIVDALAWAGEKKARLEVRGAGSKAAIGRPIGADLVLDVSGLTGVVNYAPAELVLTARPGTRLAEVEALLADAGQMLAFEPIDYGPLLGGPTGAATLGGVIASNASGPRRLKDGAARDHFLGFQAVSGRGEAFKAGGKVVKNVTGYDLSKLMAGSWGTLSVLTEVSLKVLPRPQTCATLILQGLSDTDAVRAMSLALGSPADVSGAAHLPAGVAVWAPGALGAYAVTALRLEGFGSSVAARIRTLTEKLAPFGDPALLDEPETAAFWAFIRDVRPFVVDDRPVWRISAPPMNGPAILATVQAETVCEGFYDWAGGLVWLAVALSTDAGEALVRRAAGAHGGYATLIRAPAEVRASVAVFEPEPPALAALTRRVKASFDPLNLLNPGRLFAGGARLMQTFFTDAQRTDPDTANAEGVIRKCVHCGFCTATCPTYLLLGDELDSPRGRIVLIKDMLENEREPTAEVVKHIDRCLSCLACQTTCPSGVNYMQLVDHARAYIEDRYNRPWTDQLFRALLAAVLPYPKRFRAALALAPLGRPFGGLFGRVEALRPLKAMIDLAHRTRSSPVGGGGPRSGGGGSRLHSIGLEAPSVASRQLLQRGSIEAPVAKGRVVILEGCAEPVVDPEIRSATLRLLTRAGFEVVRAPGEVCCGALTHHMGRETQALAFARANVDAWTRLIDQGLTAIVVTTSGCGTTLKNYGFMLRGDPAYAEKAARVSALARDVTELLAEAGLPPRRIEPGLSVAYHAACSLQHGQRVTAEPKALLREAGFTVREPRDAHLCCGSAGTYNILQSEIAGRLRQRKAADLEATRPDVICAGNIGCLVQIAGATDVPIVHTVQLLDWATGGRKPAALAAIERN